MSTIPTPSGQPYFGTPGNDFLNLPPTGVGLDTLYGFQGDDTLLAGLGSGFIFGGRGNDSIVGGIAGNIVQIFGDLGNDTITAGTNLITASPLTANGGPGDDSLYGGSQADSLRGGKGNDTIIGNDGSDTIFGDDGNDLIVGGSLGSAPGNAPNWIQGNEGNDTIYGAAGNDTIYGNQGNDLINVDPMMLPEGLRAAVDPLHVAGDNDIYGGKGNDTIGWSASTGRNFYVGGEGDDSLVGGAGGRTFDANGNLSDLRPAPGTNETVTTLGNDTLVGEAGNDTLVGSGGNNSLYGGAGNDYLVSGLDRDTLVGGEGADRFVYIEDVIEYNSVARDNIRGAALTGTPTNAASVTARIARADRILDFSTTQGDVIRVQGARFGGFDDGATTLSVTAGAVGVATGLDFGASTITPTTPLSAAQAANREILQEALRGSVRSLIVDTDALATTYGVSLNSVIVYIENDITLIQNGTDPAGVSITGTGVTTPYTITGATGIGLTGGDTVLAVLQPGDVTNFATAFENRGAGNFEFFA